MIAPVNSLTSAHNCKGSLGFSASNFLKKCIKNARNAMQSSLILLFIMFIVFVFLVFRNLGVYPTIFADEYVYSLFSRLQPFSEAYIPGYLYLGVYHLTNLWRDGFLECARIFNALFFVGAAPWIYLVARRVCSKNTALFIVCLTLLGPINLYTVYYMPEAMYFFLFWLLTWFMLTLQSDSSPKHWGVAGMLLGFLTLVKPHGLFLFPAIIVYIFYISHSTQGKGRWVLDATRCAGIVVIIALVTKLLLGYIFAGHAGLTLFGKFYTGILANAPNSLPQYYFDEAIAAVNNLRGHWLALCLLFGLPFACTVSLLCNKCILKVPLTEEKKMAVYTFMVLCTLVVVVVLFTTSIGMHEPFQFFRLHLRYYDFCFPLLLITLASQLSPQYIQTMTVKKKILIAIPVGITILYAIFTHLRPYSIAFVDNPELTGFIAKSLFYVFAPVSFLSLVLWVYSTQMGTKVFIYALMPAVIICSSFRVMHSLNKARIADAEDKTALFVKQYLPKEELSKLLVVGSDGAILRRVLFHVDNAGASFKVIPVAKPYDVSMTPADKDWVLVVDGEPIVNSSLFQIRVNGSTLVRVD